MGVVRKTDLYVEQQYDDAGASENKFDVVRVVNSIAWDIGERIDRKELDRIIRTGVRVHITGAKR